MSLCVGQLKTNKIKQTEWFIELLVKQNSFPALKNISHFLLLARMILSLSNPYHLILSVGPVSTLPGLWNFKPEHNKLPVARVIASIVK